MGKRRGKAKFKASHTPSFGGYRGRRAEGFVPRVAHAIPKEDDSSLVLPAMRLAPDVSGRGRRNVGGLANLGNTCFFNSCCQCLASCRPLMKYARATNASSLPRSMDVDEAGDPLEGAAEFGPMPPIGEGPVTRALRELLVRMSRNEETIRPSDLLGAVGRRNRRFAGRTQEDSEELFRTIFDEVDEEEKHRIRTRRARRRALLGLKDDETPKKDDETPQKDDETPKKDEEEEEDEEDEDDREEEIAATSPKIVSFISTLFEGSFCGEVRCSSCGARSFTRQPFVTVPVAILPSKWKPRGGVVGGRLSRRKGKKSVVKKEEEDKEMDWEGWSKVGKGGKPKLPKKIVSPVVVVPRRKDPPPKGLDHVKFKPTKQNTAKLSKRDMILWLQKYAPDWVLEEHDLRGDSKRLKKRYRDAELREIVLSTWDAMVRAAESPEEEAKRAAAEHAADEKLAERVGQFRASRRIQRVWRRWRNERRELACLKLQSCLRRYRFQRKRFAVVTLRRHAPYFVRRYLAVKRAIRVIERFSTVVLASAAQKPSILPPGSTGTHVLRGCILPKDAASLPLDTDVHRGLAQLAEFEPLQASEGNGYNCENCSSSTSESPKPPPTLRDAFRRSFFLSLPPLLVFHVQRFRRRPTGALIKLHDHVSFPPTIDMAPFVAKRPERTDHTYALVGVVSHIGSSLAGGHYIAFVRKLKKDEDSRLRILWYRVSDSSVSQTSKRSVLAAEPYLLFYERQYAAPT